MHKVNFSGIRIGNGCGNESVNTIKNNNAIFNEINIKN